ncbi:MAG: PAS domain S-box protein [Verrucomicrobiota bacterium]
MPQLPFSDEELRGSLKELAEVKFALDQHAIVAITDPRGHITYVNDKFCAISKYAREELLGQDHRIINSSHHSKEFIRELWTTIANGKVWKGEICNRAKDGSLYWVDTTIVPFLSEQGKPRQYVAIRADITERKLAEAKLRDSIKELAEVKSALDQHAIVAITDPRGRITYVNDKFCAISKYAREELLGQDHRIINSSHHNKEFIRELWTTIAHGRVWKGEICNRAKDGSLYWVDTTIVPFEGPDGKPLQYVAIRADITERKRAESRQNQLLKELAEINEELNQFAYVVSHDLKAPLRAISSLAGWLATDYAGVVGPAGKEQFNLLLGRVKRMNSLVEGILHYSRIGRLHEELVSVDLNQLVRDVVELLAPPPGIVVRVANLLPTLRAERTRLIQIFENLISNAVKYMGKPTGEIVIGCEAEGHDWKFYVRDTGPGIEAKYFEKIFQIFQTLAPRDEVESTGIGLSVVKKNVELFGGKVWVESEVGRGSVFYFRLPRAGDNLSSVSPEVAHEILLRHHVD